jgi:uncharacterized LabA/DUF88 family protein
MPASEIKSTVHVLIDYSNVDIYFKKKSKKLDIYPNWLSIGTYVAGSVPSSKLGEIRLIGSIKRTNPQDYDRVVKSIAPLSNHAGAFYKFIDRETKKSTKECPHCSGTIKENVESGVDLILALEIIKCSERNPNDIIAIVTNDRDFEPLISFLSEKGIKILHVTFGQKIENFSKYAWHRIDLAATDFLHCKLATIDKPIVIHTSADKKFCENAKTNLNDGNIESINIFDDPTIPLKEMIFLSKFLRIQCIEKGQDPRFPIIINEKNYINSKENLESLREKINSGDVIIDLPAIIGMNGCIEIRKSMDGMLQRSGDIDNPDWPYQTFFDAEMKKAEN